MKKDWIRDLYLQEQLNKSEKRVTEIYLDENGNTVFTAHYLAKRGFCCGSGCKHCPYDPKHIKETTTLKNKQ